MIVDLVLLFAGVWFFVREGTGSGLQEESPNIIIWMFTVVISIVPWYMGYLLRQFDSYRKWVQSIIKWFFGTTIIALMILMVMSFFPLIESKEAPSNAESFLIAFGMFFMVLGPLMLTGGYVDGKSIDESRKSDSPYLKLTATIILGMLTAAVVYMILIIGWFDPGWTGKIGFFPVLTAFLGGTLLGAITLAPFIYIGRWLARIDRSRIIPKLLYISLPFLVFNTLIWWNDIVLFNLSPLWENNHPSIANILWSMILAGIIPFRLIMLLKPPIHWTNGLFAVLSVGVYVCGVLHQYGAL